MERRNWKQIEIWKDVTDEQWNDWLWQLTHTIRYPGGSEESSAI